MAYVSSKPNELLLITAKEMHVLDLTCFPLKIKKRVPYKVPTCPVKKVVAHKGNKTGYIYYEDDMLLRERHIYAEKDVVEAPVMRDLIFSEPQFFARLRLYPRGIEYTEAVESV